MKKLDEMEYEYVTSLEVTTSSNEVDVKFLKDGIMVIIVRGVLAQLVKVRYPIIKITQSKPFFFDKKNIRKVIL